ncbi:MAG: ABC transporter ATP-binding protein [Bacteroidota bacterium]
MILEAVDIRKVFDLARNNKGGLEVLKGIDLNVREGEILAIVGASGAGKSTLLHILGALDRPTAGEVRFEGKNIFAMNEKELARFRNQNIGFVFQFHHLLPEFTALENVAIPAMIEGKKLEITKEKAAVLLREVGLGDRLDHKPSELSGGEQQRVAVARALMNQPKVILADEPTGNLDAANGQMLHDLLWNLSKSRRQALVIVTHNTLLASRADRVVQIADGRATAVKSVLDSTRA